MASSAADTGAYASVILESVVVGVGETQAEHTFPFNNDTVKRDHEKAEYIILTLLYFCFA